MLFTEEVSKRHYKIQGNTPGKPRPKSLKDIKLKSKRSLFGKEGKEFTEPSSSPWRNVETSALGQNIALYWDHGREGNLMWTIPSLRQKSRRFGNLVLL